MYVVLEYSKVPVTIQSYSKAHSYAKATGGGGSDQKYTRCTRRRSDAASATSTNPEKVPGLKTNNYRTFTLYGEFYPLRGFVPEEIYLGKMAK